MKETLNKNTRSHLYNKMIFKKNFIKYAVAVDVSDRNRDRNRNRDVAVRGYRNRNSGFVFSSHCMIRFS